MCSEMCIRDSSQSYATETYVGTQISNLVDSSPAALNTLNELAAALGDDANFSTTVTNSIGTKWTQDNTKISNWDTAYGWGNHASAGYLTSYTDTNTHTHLDRTDNRTISPSEFSSGDLNFGFTSWANNNTSPYADFIHLRSYTDSSGGSDNMVMFKKSGIGMRLWQQTYGSSTAYSNYEDVWHSGNLTTTNKSNYDTAYGWGNHASAGYLTSYTDTNTTYSAGTGVTLTGTTFSLTDTNAKLNLTGGTLDNGTSTTLSVKCDNSGTALVRAGGDGQGTGVFEVTQDNGSHGGGMSYNGDGTPGWASGETADHVTFYRIQSGTRTEVFHYPYNSNVVNFNSNPTVGGKTVGTQSVVTTAPTSASGFPNGHVWYVVS